MKNESDESLQEFNSEVLEQYPTTRVKFSNRTSSYPPLKTLQGGLRRRVFLILLGFAIIPSAVILFLSYLSAAETLQGRLRVESTESTQRIAYEVDRQFSQFGQVLSQTRGNVQSSYTSLLKEKPLFTGVQELPPLLEKSIYLLPEGSIFFIHDTKGHIRSEFYGLLWSRDGLPTDPVKLSRILRENADQYKLATEKRGLLYAEGESIPRGILSEYNEEVSLGPCVMISFPFESTTSAGHDFLAALIPVSQLLDSTYKQVSQLSRGSLIISLRQGVIYESSRGGSNTLVLEEVQNRLSNPNVMKNEFFMVETEATRVGVATRPLRPSGAFLENSQNQLLWHVVEIIDLQETFNALTKLFWTLVLLGLGLMMITLFAAILLSARLVQPIRELTNGMRRYAQGDLDYRVELHTHDELENLADAANIMAESLRNSYQDLASRMLELDEKANQLSLIHSISRSINKSLDLDQLFQQIVQELTGIIRCERISMALYDKESNHLSLEFVYPAERDVLPQHTIIPVDTSLMGKAIKDSTITLKSVKSPGTYFEETNLYRIGIRKVCIVPLLATNGSVGTLNLGAIRKDAFDIRELKLLERVAEPLGLALEHGRLYKQVASFAQKLEETVEKRTGELKSAQEKLVQAERFAATGSIAAHIGHEINNPLSIIKNYIKISKGKLLKETITPGDAHETREGLQIIEEEIDRIARIVSQLRQVSKPPESQAVRFSLKDELGKLMELMKAFVEKRHIQFEIVIDENLAEVVCSPDYLRQILINLIRNSIDALEGRVDAKIRIHAALSKSLPGFFYINVEDNGHGISPEHIKSIFDPFFTTKSEGKGTGLGLSVSYGLAQSMGGMMRAKSEKGKGTSIRLELPVEAKSETDAAKESLFPKNEISSFAAPKRKRNIVIG